MRTQHSKGEYTLTHAQAESVIHAPGLTFRDRCIVKCMYYAGMRVSEVCKMRIPHIDFNRHLIHIYRSKNEKTRTIPFIDAAFESDLRHWIGKAQEGRVFDINTRRVRYIVERAGVLAGVIHPDPTSSRLNPHLFRHSCARRLKDQGYPMEFIQKFLGHTSLKTTMDVYGTLSVEDMQRIAASRTGDMNLLPREKHNPEVIR